MLDMLAAIIGSGANTFILIVVILLSLVAGISATDFLKQKEKEKEYDED